MTSTEAITFQAPAKLNLALAVGPPAPPKGYHPIASWFVPIDLHDELAVTRLSAGGASTYEIVWGHDAPRPTAIDWPVEKDLAVRAHRLLEEHTGRALPVRMMLRKRVPTGGGLGGGSSDAAAMLVAVNRLFGLGLSREMLAGLSVRLGSDVAFFLDDPAGTPPRPAMVGGFGEKIERVPRVPGEAMLIFPPFGCPTADVYRAFDARAGGRAGADEGRVRGLIERSARTGRVEAAALFNDLAEPAFAVAPALAELVAGVIRPVLSRESAQAGSELVVHMTGSGSTLFVMLPTPNDGLAGRLIETIQKQAPLVRGTVVNLC